MKNKQTNKTAYNCIYYKNKDGMGGTAIDKALNIEITIHPTHENFALDKDEVVVSAHSDHDGVLNGSIQSITKHNTTNLSGFIQRHKTKYLLNVNNHKFGRYLVMINGTVDNINRDEIYNSVIVEYPTTSKPFFSVELVNSIGQIGEDKAYIAQLILEANLPTEFSQAALLAAKNISDDIPETEIAKRIDLRMLNFVTIDGADARDFDDAVYCELDNSGIFHLYVAIADVAHYVTDGSAINTDAILRGTSVYFPRQVIPMLPEHLSNGLCSLNPNVDRLVMVCQMQINASGEIIAHKVYNGAINSKARLTYEQVQEWLDNLALTPDYLKNNISNLNAVFHALLNQRHIRGAIDFDTIEPAFVFDENNVVTDIKARTRLNAHRLIEECMLAANVSVAEFLSKHEQPTLYRIHDKPSEEKFNNLKAYLNSLAIKFDVAYENLTPTSYAKLLQHVHKNHIEDFQVIQQSVLRSMQLAMYDANNIGHFGLSYTTYLHFTSPIRRYPDLLVHRAAKKVIKGKHYQYAQSIDYLGEHTSFTERRAEDLERKSSAFYKCQYAKTHIGSQFEGIVTSVTSFGLFVYLPKLLIDGLLHITELGGDYFVFDDKKQVLVGKKTGFKYNTGQSLHVEIAGVNMAKMFIDLTLVEQNL